MAQERLAPDAILEQTNLTGSVADIQNDPDSPDGNWLLTTAAGASVLRNSYGTPTNTPTTGAGLQEFRCGIRKNATGGNDAGWSLQLYENGTLISTLATGTTSSTTGEVVAGTWDASSLGTADGSLVEFRIEQTSGHTGTPENRRYLEINADEWNAETSASQSVSVGDILSATGALSGSHRIGVSVGGALSATAALSGGPTISVSTGDILTGAAALSGSHRISVSTGALLSGATALSGGYQAPTVNLTLVADGGAPVTNQTGIRWAWFDAATLDALGAPTAQGTAETTDGSGNLVIDVTGTAKLAGEIGTLFITTTDGNADNQHKQWNGPVALNTATRQVVFRDARTGVTPFSGNPLVYDLSETSQSVSVGEVLTALGAISGSHRISVSVGDTLTGVGALSGGHRIGVSVGDTLTATAALSGTPRISVSTGDTLTVAGSIAGGHRIGVSTGDTLSATASLSGATRISVSTGDLLTATAALTGGPTITGNVSVGDILTAAGLITGGHSISVSTGALLAASGAISGGATISVSTGAVLTATGALSGGPTIVGNVSVGDILSASGLLSGGARISVSTGATLAATASLSGGHRLSVSTGATLGATAVLSGGASVQGNVSKGAILTAVAALSGGHRITVSTGAALSVTATLSGASSITGGTVFTAVALSGVYATTKQLNGVLDSTINLQGKV